MRIVGLTTPLTVAQIYLVHGFMLKRGVTEVDVRNEPFLRRQIEHLAPKPAIAPEPYLRGPREVA